jgi:ligand-binding sensor domain-containing protein/signal transduction histidine kinase
MMHAFFRLPRVLCALTACLAASWCGATTLRDFGKTEQFFFETFGIDSGLPGVSVVGACQTHDGYLWVATGGGLARFDGVRFASYRPANTPAFLSALVYCLLEDRDRTLWIGTSRGLVKMRDGKFERVPGLDDNEVHTLAQDSAGRVWAGTYGKGLFVCDGDGVRHCESPALEGARYVLRLLADSTGRIWVGTEMAGVVVGTNGVFSRLPLPPGVLTDRVDCLAEQPRGTIWFGTRADGIYRLRDGDFLHLTREQIGGGSVTDLQASHDGGLWIIGQRLAKIADPDHPEPSFIPDVPREGIFTAHEDREGNLWLCAKERGLIRSARLPYRLISKRDGLPDDSIRSITRDPAGNLWLAGQGGHDLVRVAPDGTLSMPLVGADGSPGPRPAVVLAARDGAIWLGMAGQAKLRVWRDGVETSIPSVRAAYGLFEDHNGAIWIGTANDGVFRWQNGQLASVTQTGGEPIQAARWFAEGPDGTIYAATWSSGFARIEKDRVVMIDRGRGLPTDEVRAIHVDRENRVWLGFRGRGLGLWENGRCWNPDLLSQTLADHVSAIAEDAHGQLWVGTPAGVMWVDKADLVAAASGQLAVSAVRVGQLNRSLQTASVWSGDRSVVCSGGADRLLFATRDGVLTVSTNRLPAKSPPPPVHVERVVVDGVESMTPSSIALSAGARDLAIDYTAPSFAQPSQIFFRYRLEGVDAGWVEARTRRTAYYGNLPPGHYTFRVIACSVDGVWPTAGAELAVIQNPHFYQTRWFFGVALLGLVAVGAGVLRWSNRRLQLRLERLEEKQAMERERRRIAKNLHDDLGANLTEISLYAESLQKKSTVPALTQEMRALSERVRALAGTLDAIVWSANPANDSLDRLGTFVCGLFQDLCQVAGIRCRIDLPLPLPPAPLSPDERSNLFLAIREAMTNLAKHSGATEAWLRLKISGRFLEVALEDNGHGFDLAAAEARDRNGLTNMRSRLAELKGRLEIVSSTGAGTKIFMRLPVNLPPAPASASPVGGFQATKDVHP